jgi:hypothetical protein
MRNVLNMRLKIFSLAIITIVVLNALMIGVSITNTPEARLEVPRLVSVQNLSQESEYNVSSYYDFAEATMDILVSRLMVFSTGDVFHASDSDWEIYELYTSTANYYWLIAALARAYHITGNETYKTAVTRAAMTMVETFLDTSYPCFYVNNYSLYEVRTTKRAGVQAYAYWALELAESVNSTLDFTAEKQSAISCLTDFLYDETYGGFFFFTMRNGSLSVPAYIDEVYPNDGKRLDHLALGATALFDAGIATGNSTLLQMAEHALNFLRNKMKYYFEMEYAGLKLAVERDGGAITLEDGIRPGYAIVTDINAIAMRALLKGYETTGNSTYLTLVEDTLASLLANNWDTEFGGWFEVTVDGEPYDPDPIDGIEARYYKYTEIQFQMILALEELYETTLEQFSLRIVIDTLELILTNLWESVDEGFVRNGDREWFIPEHLWEIHYTAVQSQGVLALERIWSYGLPFVSNVRIQPTNPRPNDIIDFIATAHDSDGISMVYVNYTMNHDGNETNGILILSEHPLIGNVYNSTIENLPDQTSCNFVVVANDTTGREFIAGSYYFIVRVDTFPPVVSLRAIYPIDEVRIGDDVIIDFEVYEFPSHSFVYICELWWRVNSGAFSVVNMTFMGIDEDLLIFRYNLGQFQAGDQVEFEGRIKDEAGNIGVSARHRLTILGPNVNITPIAAWQIAAAAGLIIAPGFGYMYTKNRKRGFKEAQREGKKAAKKRARRRGPRRRRQL